MTFKRIESDCVVENRRGSHERHQGALMMKIVVVSVSSTLLMSSARAI